jgi:serine/threonine protein kinase
MEDYIFGIVPAKSIDPSGTTNPSKFVLGKGTYSTVFKATRISSGITVAIKRKSIRHSKFEDLYETGENNLIDEFEREYKILSSLDNFHIIKVIDYRMDHRHEYLILEFAPFGDLLNYINKYKPLSEMRAKNIFRQLVSAVKYLHDRNIIHADIKLENILIFDIQEDFLEIKLGDFGFAEKISGEKCQYSRGSLNYAAPEVALYNPVVGTEMDIWSLGVSLYAMLYKKFPLILKDGDPDNNKNEYLRIASAGPRFDLVPHIKISDILQNLLKNMLSVSTERRIKIREIESDPWLLQPNIKLDLFKLHSPKAPRSSVSPHLSPLAKSPNHFSPDSAISPNRNSPRAIASKLQVSPMLQTRSDSDLPVVMMGIA